jgi:glycosyltransferase involved in cell wall biosynthesis
MSTSKIALIISPSAVGGAEIYSENLINGLVSLGHSVKIFISHNKSYYEYFRQHYSLHTIYLGNSLWKIFCANKYSNEIKDCSFLISNGYHSLFVALLLRARYNKLKHIDIKHGWIQQNLCQKSLTFLDKSFSIFCNKSVVVNTDMKKDLSIFTKNFIHIPTGIPIDNKVNIYPKKRGDQINIGLVGRLEPEKQFHLAIMAVNEISHRNIKLHIVGSGSASIDLQLIPLNNNIEVILYGFLPRKDIPYRLFDILLITSKTEGCPLVALEALMHGVYIISTDVGCMRNLLRKNRGKIVLDSTSDIQKAIAEYLEREPSEIYDMSQKSRNFVLSCHNLDEMVMQYDQLLFKL